LTTVPSLLSFRENLDSGGPLGPAIVVIISAIAELERSLIVERVRAGLSRAKLDGRHIGRAALQVDHAAILQDRAHGRSLRADRKEPSHLARHGLPGSIGDTSDPVENPSKHIHREPRFYWGRKRQLAVFSVAGKQ
jgi:hypothetical protein